MKDLIVKRRKELGMTQQQLAEKLNISDKVVSKWETGRSLPDTSLLARLADVLELSCDELLRESDTAAQIDDATRREASAAYKNSCIVTMALQFVAAAFVVGGRIVLDRVYYYGDGSLAAAAYALMALGALCEIAAIVFFLVKRNVLSVRYSARTDLDKKHINLLLFCTYPLILAVIIAFVMLHGLSSLEQLIVFLIAAAIALLLFAICFILNKRRK